MTGTRSGSRTPRVTTLGSLLSVALLVSPTITAAQPIDVRIARWSQRPALQKSTALDVVTTTAEWIAAPGTSTIPIGVFIGARLGRNDRLGESALRVEATTLVAAGLTQVLKRTIGRARPYVVNDSDAYDIAFGSRFRGGQDYRSFPSGHATMSFAAATALMIETRRVSPAQTKIVTPAAYAVATLASFGRVLHDKHWTTDVLAGAIIGTVSAHLMEKVPVKRR